MTGIELFCGKGAITKTFRDAGHEMISLDNRKRKGVCEPTLKLDILSATAEQFPLHGKRPAFVFSANPCNANSYASGNYYFDNLIPKESAAYFIKLMNRSLWLIDELNPEYFFLENPRGRMRYSKSLIDWLIKRGGMVKQICFGAYGFPTTKPTDIFTNALDFPVRKMLRYGRGAKNDIGTFNNLTVCQRQEIPAEFAKDLLRYMEAKKAPGTISSWDLNQNKYQGDLNSAAQTAGEILKGDRERPGYLDQVTFQQ